MILSLEVLLRSYFGVAFIKDLPNLCALYSFNHSDGDFPQPTRQPINDRVYPLPPRPQRYLLGPILPPIRALVQLIQDQLNHPPITVEIGVRGAGHQQVEATVSPPHIPIGITHSLHRIPLQPHLPLLQI